MKALNVVRHCSAERENFLALLIRKHTIFMNSGARDGSSEQENFTALLIRKDNFHEFWRHRMRAKKFSFFSKNSTILWRIWRTYFENLVAKLAKKHCLQARSKPICSFLGFDFPGELKSKFLLKNRFPLVLNQYFNKTAKMNV
jgi:hypothetical protein